MFFTFLLLDGRVDVKTAVASTGTCGPARREAREGALQGHEQNLVAGVGTAWVGFVQVLMDRFHQNVVVFRSDHDAARTSQDCLHDMAPMRRPNWRRP
ncbi:hypothetical protein GCM10023350_09860 [Nocardioides endophyticus]|uniref:Uncharacterized protein n=1 Tax=Nocardioides endophyticus TaxID=1353775 RepID=A0ABP8YJI2_9ACTN